MQMYKVFINNKHIFLTENKEITNKNEQIYFFSSELELHKTIDEFEKNHLYDKLFVVGNPEEIYSLFQKINAAGGLVRKNNEELLFIFRFGKWDLPKGKMEIGETPENTAIREVMEETGISGLSIIKELIPTYHTYKIGGIRVIKKTFWYEMSFIDDSQILPQKVEDITAVKWIKINEIPWIMRNSYASIIELLSNSGYL